MDNKTARQDLETVIRVEDLALGSMRKLRAIQDWLREQAARSPASGEVEPVGVIELTDYVQLDDSDFIPRRKVLSETSKGSIQDLPVGTKVYTHPPAKVPEGVSEALQRLIENSESMGPASREDALLVAKHRHALLTTPTPATTAEAEWKPAHGMSDDLPLIGEPVMGYHRDWVDEDFCKDGIRECFLFGDGSEWQSARWDGYSDQWIVADGAPELWHPHPAPPTVQEGE